MRAMTMTAVVPQSGKADRPDWRWVHVPAKPSYLSGAAGPVAWVQGVGGYVVGIYAFTLWISDLFNLNLIEGRPRVSALDLGVVLVVIAIFLLIGFLGLTMSRNLASLARIIELRGDEVRVEFWWRWRRGVLKFPLRDVVGVTYCGLPKGGTGWQHLVSLMSWGGLRKAVSRVPLDPNSYRIQVRGQEDFYISGADEQAADVAHVDEAVARLTAGGTQQASVARPECNEIRDQ